MVRPMQSTSVLTASRSERQPGIERPPPQVSCRVQLLGGFRATRAGVDVDLPASTWRLVAFLAIVGRPVERPHVANTLWMDKSEARAHANLRSCLWRLRQADAGIVTCTATHLRIGALVQVDLAELIRFARRLTDPREELDLDGLDSEWFCAELLPDWYDDFVEVEREQFRQLRFHALEAFAYRLQRVGRTGRALDVALTAVAAAPLRESAHRLVISLHLDEGNISEALRQYAVLQSLLEHQLGVQPSSTVRRLVDPWLRPATPR
jgi:DNA-binding SARP family transcriptional activator